MDATFNVEQVGPSVSVQDAGRTGGLRYGVSTSGAMDRLSFRLANTAVGNTAPLPAIEVSLGGITLTCVEGSVSIGIVGGSFSSTLNKRALPAWSYSTISAGDTLRIRPGKWGSWCYLAFAGNLQADDWLGSHSVHLNTGVCGRPIATGDSLHVSTTRVLPEAPSSLLDISSLKPVRRFRAVLGPQHRFFSEAHQQQLFEQNYTVSNEFDRMGMRLSGFPLTINAKLDMPSEPITRGSLQIPGHGDPICLMADHHTAGGYPKIATVISSDQDDLAQLRTGDVIRFESVDVQEAIAIARERNNRELALHEIVRENQRGVDSRLWGNNLISGATSGLDKNNTR